MSAPIGGIHPTAVIGDPPEHRDYRAKPGQLFAGVTRDLSALIEAFVTVDAGVFRPTTIGARSWLMKKVHVGHDCLIGCDVEIAPLSSIGGECVIEDGVRIGQGVVTVPRITIGAGARIGAGAVVTRDVPAGETWVGNPADEITRQTARRRLVDELVAERRFFDGLDAAFGDGCEISLPLDNGHRVPIEEPRYSAPQDGELEQRQRAAFRPGGWMRCG